VGRFIKTVSAIIYLARKPSMNNLLIRLFFITVLILEAPMTIASNSQVACYAEIKGVENTLNGECTLIVPTPWNRGEEFSIGLDSGKEVSDPKYYFYYLEQYKLFGKVMWSAYMNSGANSTHAQNFLGEDFDIHWDKSGKTDGVCWENPKHLICFKY
tara:strand:- start:556 stop:1026 length:471 start_codon:yes stop_codon:yes gene_type:complete